tara:strand:+ start:2219 stop:2404 length:186 start_codon:yes stop_codon:yes gene_type:complete
MPTKKQIENAKAKLKVVKKPKGNAPKLPNRLQYIIIRVDGRKKADRQMFSDVQEYLRGQKK